MFKAALSLLQFLLPRAEQQFWFQTGVGAKSEGPVLTDMPPIQAMHDNAHLKGLPVQEVPDPF